MAINTSQLTYFVYFFAGNIFNAVMANKAAAACENMAKGINSMTDGTTGITYTIGINGGMVYLESV